MGETYYCKKCDADQAMLGPQYTEHHFVGPHDMGEALSYRCLICGWIIYVPTKDKQEPISGAP